MEKTKSIHRVNQNESSKKAIESTTNVKKHVAWTTESKEIKTIIENQIDGSVSSSKVTF